MSATGKTPVSGLTSGTFEKLQLNAGVFLKNFNVSTYTDSTTLATAIETEMTSGTNLLGATRGGGTFVAEPDTRQVDVDGARGHFKGDTIIDGWTCKLTTTLIEMTAANFKLALGAATTATSGQVTTITLNNTIDATASTGDYLTTLTWIGNIASGQLCAIQLDNALCLKGFTFKFTDKGEGEIPIEVTGHSASPIGVTTAPAKIYIFDNPAS